MTTSSTRNVYALAVAEACTTHIATIDEMNAALQRAGNHRTIEMMRLEDLALHMPDRCQLMALLAMATIRGHDSLCLGMAEALLLSQGEANSPAVRAAIAALDAKA